MGDALQKIGGFLGMEKLLLLIAALAFTAKGLPVEAQSVVSGRTVEYFTPNMFKKGSQIERIQQAIDEAQKYKAKVVIPGYDAVNKSAVWLIDKAILLPGNTELELDNCTIKLSDRCRDNFIRSANAGLGISKVKPLSNIRIIGKGNVLLEGAANPRATGDHNKALAKNPKGFTQSYGSDAGKPGENQKGGWRNHAIILAHINVFEISGIQLKDYHAHGIVLERCTNGAVKDITFQVRQSVNIEGVERQVLNQDGMGIRFGCRNIIIDRCRGNSGDDFINIGLTDTGVPAGAENVNVVSGSVYGGATDNIANIYLQNWQDFYSISHRAIRIMPAGRLRIQNVFVENMTINALSNQGLVAEYADHIRGLFVKNIITWQPVKAKGIRDASFRDILYLGKGDAIDVADSDSVVVDNVRKAVF
ncbi:glycosyl hydrolase family 28 protein [Niabella yanshanensis]|uniref:Glycosyl hydrolase family 28 protein n=1 Tax=Niabella yanshanensis TaxID=577386 RepID=A0ABZ0W5R6_9BACT|nr:glycosyl hydrolase family 28 protein [Niabella yanshanensis]WQD38526.1 glycosyl hydrolase family 28 protein [Niabella yanshanensis]